MMTTTQNKTEDFNVCFSFLLNLKCIALSFFNFAFISFYVSIFFYYYNFILLYDDVAMWSPLSLPCVWKMLYK